MRGVIYARYSHGPHQTEQSIEGQVADCRAFAAQKGIDVLEVYADRHVSGTSTAGRDEFQRMLQDAERHKFDAVITWKIDRFGRSREDIAVNKIRLRRAGVVLMYAKESLPEGPEGILLESVLEGLAEYYSADLRQKIQRGLRESAKKGQYTGGHVLYGYKIEEKKAVPDPEAAETVREIFRRYLLGASQDDLRDILWKATGKRPVKAVIYRMLRNRRYLGNWEHAGITIPVEPIIDEETFERAQAMLAGSIWVVNGRAKVDYLLSKKCFCAECGAMMTAETGTGKSGKKYHYYKCRTKACSLKPVPQDEIEELVIRRTREDILTEEMIGKLTTRIMAVQEEQHAGDPASALRKRLEELKKRQERIMDAIEEGAGKGLVARLNAIEEEMEEIQKEIDRAELLRPMVPEELVRAWLSSFRSGDVTDPSFRRRLVQTFVDHVEVAEDVVTVFYNSTDKKPQPSVRLRPDKWRYRAAIRTLPEVCGSFIVCRFPRKKAK